MGFVNLGTRNKSTLWEYMSSYSFLHAQMPLTKFHISHHLGVGEGLPNQHCHHTDDFAAFKKLFVEEFISGLYTADFFDQLHHSYRDKLKDIEQMNQGDFTKDDNAALAKKFLRGFANTAESHKAMLMGLYTMYLDDYYTDKLSQVLAPAERTTANSNELKSFLLTTPRTSFAQVEEDALYDIEQAFHASNADQTESAFTKFCQLPAIQTKLNQLVEKFGWFHMEYIHDPYTVDDYKKDLWERINQANTAERKAPAETRREIIAKQEQFFASHPNPEFQQLTYALQEFAFILDDTKVATVRGIFLMRPILTEIGKRINLSLYDTIYLAPPEIVSLLEQNKTADKKLIDERKKFRVILMENGTITVSEGKPAKEIAGKLLPAPSKKSAQQKEVKGVVAYPGIIRGKVTLIRSVKDKDKFTKGDVLVTHDGTAELTAFLQAAAAIVTDEGGIICHSAIVAREMKTPCLVGTKIATQVFKDGDAIEVDATHGVARLLPS